MCAIRSWTSGSCFSSHSSFGAVKPVSARLPVAAISCSSPIRSSISSHSAPRALVVPQDRRPQHLLVGVERDEPVHLARQPDAGHLVGAQLPRAPPASPRHQSSGSCSAQPGFGVESAVLDLGAPDDLAVLGDGERLQPAGADVEPDRDAHAAGAPSAA